MVGRRLALSLARSGAARMTPAVARSFHVSGVAQTSFDDSRIARPHCHHASLWKIWKPLSANGSLMTGEGEYMMEVLKTMPASAYKDAVMAKTEFKLSVLKSGQSEEEMKAAIGFGELEEVHAVVRGELELIKKLGKEWFTMPHPDCPPEELEIANAKA